SPASSYSVLLLLITSFPDPVQAVGLSEASFVSAESGKTVTLHCKFVERSGQSIRSWVWYKQRAGQEPQEVAVNIPEKRATTSLNRLKIIQNFDLTIEQTEKTDEGMYFCGVVGTTITFSKGTFLAVTDRPQLSTSVLQTQVWGSFSPGESVTLQCTVLSEIRAADLRVLWFRAAAGQSFPEIIYTHQNSSSRQCEISSSTNSSVYNFSKNILDHNHTGTYYCAVEACGKIIFGNGALVQLGNIFLLFMCNSINGLGFKASKNVTETGFVTCVVRPHIIHYLYSIVSQLSSY
uniref:Ig-like domain-containing protein n=1 Tax=Pygocentrus nattereri TaxID=42514 RepID=A0AAR2KR59_PYGNA